MEYLFLFAFLIPVAAAVLGCSAAYLFTKLRGHA